MGALTRAHDWSQTTLGPPETWPLSLRTTVGILLHSAFPTFLFWGHELICFYNDAYRPSLGNNGKHPALGKKAKEVWSEIWDFIGPIIKQVIETGEPVFFEDQLLPIHRNGRLEDVYWTFSYSPAYGDDGQISGVFVTCTETTEKIVNAKLQHEKSELLRAVFNGSLSGISVLATVRDEQGAIIDFDYRLVNYLTEQSNSRTDLVGKRYSDIHAGYKQAGLFDDFVKVVNTGQAIERERHYMGEGFDNWYETIAVKLNDGVVFSFRDITAMVQVRQQIDLNQQQLLASFEQLPVGIAIISEEDLTYRMVNPFYGEVAGRAPDELVGKPLLDALPEIWGQGFDDLLRQVIATGIPFLAREMSVQIARRNQLETIYVDFTYQPHYEGNRISGVMVVCLEVTEQVLARKAVETTGQYYRHLTDTVPAVIWETRADGCCTYLSRQWYDLTGQTPTEAEGDGWLNATHPDDKAESGRLFLEANQHQTPFFAIYRLRHHNGLYRWVIDKANPRFGSDGAYQGMIGTVVDIHEQKIAEENLGASEQRFEAAVDAVQGILWTNNARGEMEGEQPGWAALTGQTYADYQGYGWASAAHPDDAQPTVIAWREAVARRGLFEFEHRVRLKNGHYEPFAIRAIPLLNPDNTIREWVGVHTNVNKQRKAETALRTSEAKLRSLIDNAPVAIGLLVGRDMVIELSNQTFIDIVGKGPDIAGKPMGEVMPELTTENQPFLQILDEVYTTGQLFQSFDAPVDIVRQGVMTRNYYNMTYSPLRNEAGEIYAILDVSVDVTGQILAQQQVEQSKARFQDLIQQAEAGIVVLIGEEMRVEIVNDAYARLIDRSCEDLLGKPLFSIIPEAESPFRALLDGVRNTGEPIYLNEAPYPVGVKGGQKEGFLNVAYQPYREYDGRIVGVTALCQDVTEQVLSRQKVEESEAKFRSLIMEAPVATCLYVGPNAIIELANPELVKILGKGDSVIGKPLIEAAPELIGQPFSLLLADLYQSGETYEGFSIPADIVVDGMMGRYYYDFTYKPLRSAANDVYAILCMAVDVTEQVLVRQKIEEAEAALRGAIELAQLGSWAYEVESSLFTYSDRVKNWFGFPSNSIVADKALVAVHEVDRARVEAAIVNALQPGSDGIYDVEHALTEPHSGRELIVHAQGKTTFDAQGQPIRMTGSIQDVTQDRHIQHELERQVQARTRQLQESVHDLKRSNENLQQFAYIASHDLQEPLRKIQAFSDLIQNQYGEQLGETGNDYLGRMQSSANRMSTLIRDLLTYSRISTQQDSSSSVALDTVLNAVLSDLDLVILETGAVVTVAPLPIVQGDKSQLGQLFQNLLSNALKFHKPGESPRISITSQTVAARDLPPVVKPTRIAMAHYCIAVTDNGIGFEEKYAERIFQVFQRLHGKSQYAGTGIGLAICEKVVANHGGAITAQSQPGKGATFTIYLPA